MMNNENLFISGTLESDEILWRQVESAIKKPNYFGLCNGCEFNNKCAVASIERGTWDCTEYDKFVADKSKGVK